MKGYFIDAGRRVVEAVDYEFSDLRTYLPGGICVAAVLENGDVIYVDDEGLLKPATVAFRIKRRADGQPMMSNGFVTGPDSDDGETTLPPGSSIAEIEAELEWLTVDQALAWLRARHEEPAVLIHSGEGPPLVTARWGDFLPDLEDDQ